MITSFELNDQLSIQFSLLFITWQKYSDKMDKEAHVPSIIRMQSWLLEDMTHRAGCPLQRTY